MAEMTFTNDQEFPKNINILNRFVIKSKLGEGSFSKNFYKLGKIYEAFDVKLNKLVALKIEKEGKSKNILEKEYEILKKMQISNYVPRVYDFVKTWNCNLIVMELLGKNLSFFKKNTESISECKAIDILKQMLNAIEELHSNGFIHRDIKPTNFVLGREDELKVYMVDFGLARAFRGKDGQLLLPRQNMDFRGTLVYASLNAHYKKDLSRRDDLWSFLFVVLELLCQHLPWRNIKENKEIIVTLKEDFIKNPSLILNNKFYSTIQIIEILEYLKTLNFGDTPDYSFISKKLDDMIYVKLKKKDLEALINIKSENNLSFDLKLFQNNFLDKYNLISNMKSNHHNFDRIDSYFNNNKNNPCITERNYLKSHGQNQKFYHDSYKIKNFINSPIRMNYFSSQQTVGGEIAVNLNDDDLKFHRKRKRDDNDKFKLFGKSNNIKDQNSFFSKISLKNLCDQVNEICKNVVDCNKKKEFTLKPLLDESESFRSQKNMIDYFIEKFEKFESLKKKKSRTLVS